ncbi:hypothetical protein OIB37_00610 [Streptomyces sp. NBC_00820]|uniref:hypothetical protein n=1 Tax=Streptomyces sp. NBC_00820 TaxID=2975842 RepID=UPI002ED654D3|nr:hypothetical protein OIB37_00610 [Streptomyces sp. NBC_00820]
MTSCGGREGLLHHRGHAVARCSGIGAGAPATAFFTPPREQGASEPILMAKSQSRHKMPTIVRRYFKPSPEAIVEVVGLHAPGDAQR